MLSGIDLFAAIVQERGHLIIGSGMPIPVGTVLPSGSSVDYWMPQPVFVIEETVYEDFEEQVKLLQRLEGHDWPINNRWSYFYRVSTD
jgi:hypothetical protein